MNTHIKCKRGLWGSEFEVLVCQNRGKKTQIFLFLFIVRKKIQLVLNLGIVRVVRRGWNDGIWTREKGIRFTISISLLSVFTGYVQKGSMFLWMTWPRVQLEKQPQWPRNSGKSAASALTCVLKKNKPFAFLQREQKILITNLSFHFIPLFTCDHTEYSFHVVPWRSGVKYCR